MTIRMTRAWIVLSAALVTAGFVGAIAPANAQTQVSDAFTGTSTTNPWEHFGYACLTAGTTTATFPVTNNVSSVPGCGLTTADAPGSGALRLTGAVGNETGAIISPASMKFPSNQGIQVTFTTYTYGGNKYSGGGSGSSYPQTGADGIAFYLLDAAGSPNLGSFGGSLGYSCANAKAVTGTSPGGSDGMAGAYLGLGMDEFGNYLNSGDNTNTGVTVGTSGSTGLSVAGANSISSNPYGGTTTVTDSGGSEFQPGRIGMRGYGNVNLAALTAAATAGGATTAPTNTDVENTCLNGGTYNYTVANPTPTYSYTYSYTSGRKSVTYSGALYQKSGNTYKAAGNTISGNTSSATNGYTGTDGTPYGAITSGSGKNATTTYVLIASSQSVSNTTLSKSATFADYPVIPKANMILPSTSPIANETATSRFTSGSKVGATAINYKLQVTSTGLLSLWYSYNGGNYVSVITGQDISASNGTMPANFLFGFGASTGGGTNIHEITCFLATPANLSASSAGLNVQQAGSVRSGTQVYLAFYHPSNWWGQLDAQDLDVLGNTVTINPVANWDASCVLTGGDCPSMESTLNPSVTITKQATRALVTWSGAGGAGIPFTYGRLTTTQKGWLQAGTTTGDTGASNLVDYLSGNRSNEVPSSNATSSQIYRARTSVLGDIIDASPVWVGAPSSPYTATWADKLWPNDDVAENATGVTSYTTWSTNNATRLNVVYMGSNDGFMHAFESGSYAADGITFDKSTNDGKELFAYMPEAALQSIHSATAALDYSSVNYGHNYFVDATPGTGDLFYGGTWHTWLVGGLGPGGNAIYAMDITDPTTFGVGNIKGEWGANTGSATVPATASINPVTGVAAATGTNTLVCDNVASCAANLGQTYGTPQIRRMHNGEWAIIFGNGLNSAVGGAGIYIMTVSSAGTIDHVYYLDTGVTETGSKPDGIAYVTPVDLDGDHITDYVYAGDVYGNVWRFDLTSDKPASWQVTNYGSGTKAQPLFTTPTTSICTPPVTAGCTKVSTNQPITTALVVLSVAPSAVGLPRVMVEFGTGAVTPQTNSSDISYAPGQQAMYGIWDWNVGGTVGASYSGLSATSNPAAPTTALSTSNLLLQTITGEVSSSAAGSGVGYRTVSNTPICFVGTNCGTASGVYGWYMNLTGKLGNNGVGGSDQTEQVVYSPIESEGAFIVNTTIPANNTPLTCTVASAQGWTMALNPASGGAFTQSFFSAMGGGSININGSPVSGIAVNGTGSPSVVTANGNPYLVSQTVTGAGSINQINPQNNSGGRLTWLQLH